MSSRFIHIVAYVRISFFFLKGWIIFHCTYITHFVYPFIHWWTLGLLPTLGYCEDNHHLVHVQWTQECKDLFEIQLLILWDIYPEVELLDDTVVLFKIFWGSFILFSIVAEPFYIPTNSVQVFQFLHILDEAFIDGGCWALECVVQVNSCRKHNWQRVSAATPLNPSLCLCCGHVSQGLLLAMTEHRVWAGDGGE